MLGEAFALMMCVQYKHHLVSNSQNNRLYQLWFRKEAQWSQNWFELGGLAILWLLWTGGAGAASVRKEHEAGMLLILNLDRMAGPLLVYTIPTLRPFTSTHGLCMVRLVNVDHPTIGWHLLFQIPKCQMGG